MDVYWLVVEVLSLSLRLVIAELVMAIAIDDGCLADMLIAEYDDFGSSLMLLTLVRFRVATGAPLLLGVLCCVVA